MKKLILCLLFIHSLYPTNAQENIPQQKNEGSISKHYVGLNAGSSSGIGFSYKYVKNRWGFQVSGIPIFNDQLVFTSIGLAGTYRVQDPSLNKSNTDFLVYGGIHTFSWLNGTNSYNSNFNTAIGFGFEHHITNRLDLSMMAGYGVYIGDRFLTMIAGEFGVHYRVSGLSSNK